MTFVRLQYQTWKMGGGEVTVWPMNLAWRFCRTTLHSASELLATSTDWQSGAAPIQDSAWLPALNLITSAPVAASSAQTMQSAPTLYSRPLLPAPAAYAREATPLQGRTSESLQK